MPKLIAERGRSLKQAARTVETLAYQLAGDVDATIVGQLMLIANDLDRLSRKLVRMDDAAMPCDRFAEPPAPRLGR